MHKKYFDPAAFSKIVVDIYQELRPSLTIVDGILAMEGDGPGSAGTPRKAGVLLAGSDCVALDSILARIMGLRPLDILTTKEAVSRGLGVGDIGSIRILGEALADVIGRPFRLPRSTITSKLPRPITDLVKKMVRFYPRIDHSKCTRCGSCVRICPQKVISINSGRTEIDYRGCISCFCCQETCAFAAIKVRKSLLARVAGL